MGKARLSAHGAPNLSKALVGELGAQAANVSYSLAWADGEPFPLRWGEVVPLSFIREYLNKTGASVLTWSMPARRYAQSGAPMTAELLQMGATLGEKLESLPMRVVVIISSDLAHTHLASGPYGFSKAAEPFDLAIAEWARTLNDDALLVKAKSLVGDALSCGYTGLVMLHGIMSRADKQRWQPIHRGPFAIAHPTYYGMLVAGFQPVQDESILVV